MQMCSLYLCVACNTLRHRRLYVSSNSASKNNTWPTDEWSMATRPTSLLLAVKATSLVCSCVFLKSLLDAEVIIMSPASSRYLCKSEESRSSSSIEHEQRGCLGHGDDVATTPATASRTSGAGNFQTCLQPWCVRVHAYRLV